MSHRRRSQQLRIVEALEPRQMLSRGVAAGTVHRLALPPRPDLDAVAWDLIRHPGQASHRGLGELAAELRRHPAMVRADGAGSVLAWELMSHPAYTNRHRLRGWASPPINAAPVGASGPTTTAPALPGGQPVLPPGGQVTALTLGGGITPDSAAPRFDTAIFVTKCSCEEPTANGSAPPPVVKGSGLGGGVMNSDAGLITGQLFMHNSTAWLMSRGESRSLSLEYASLQADPRPVVQLWLTTPANSNSASIASIKVSLKVDGGPILTGNTWTNVSLSDGDVYRVVQQVDATALPTGIHNVTVLVDKYNSTGAQMVEESYDGTFDVVNRSSTPLGAGWSIGGLQTITTNALSSKVMLNAGPEGTLDFGPSSSGYAAPMGETSTLARNGDGTWTRSYPDGTVIRFDASGRETSAADRNGNTTTYAYVAGGPAAGALQTATDPAGKVTTLAYDPGGHLATITDGAGRVTTTTFTGGDLTRVVDPDGATTQYAYTGHRITGETNPDGKTATITYDPSTHMVTGETLFGGIATTTIAAANGVGLSGGSLLPRPSNFIGTVTDPNGHTTRVGADAMGDASSVVDANGKTTIIDRDMATGWVTTVTDPDGRATQYQYDTHGNVTRTTRNDSTYMTVSYDPNFSRPTSVTDFRGLTTTFTLDTHGNATRRTDPDTLHEDYTYNAAGQVLTDTDRSGRTTSYHYDATGRLDVVTEPDAGAGTATVTFSYNAAGDVLTATDELGHAATMTYDAMGRVLTAKDAVQAAAGKATTYGYDPAGNLTSITDAINHLTTLIYDARNRLTGVVDPFNQGTGRQWTYAYDGYNLTSTTDPNGHATAYTYDPDNRPLTVSDANNNAITYAYTPGGLLSGVTSPNGNATAYTYDFVGRLKTATLPGTADNGSGMQVAVVTTYAYNNDDQVTSVTDALGHATTSAYDNLGRLTSVTDALTHATAYGYDNAGNLTSVTDPLTHATTYTYDARNRLLTETRPAGGGTTTYTYDQHNRLATLKDAVLNVTSYGYDNADRVLTTTDPRAKVTTDTYDLVGNLTQVVDRDNRTTQFTYDADDREATEKWIPAGGGAATYTATYTRDPVGRLTSEADNFSQYAYAYDNGDRVTGVDNLGTPGSPRVILTYGYDHDGNVTSVADNFNGLTSSTYDVRDELTRVTQGQASGTGAAVAPKRVDLAYDAALRRTSLTRYADLAGATAVLTTAYVYDNANRLTTLTHKTPGGTIRSQYGYTLDAANRLTSEARTWTTTGGTTATDTVGYAYTNDDQLTGVTHTNGSFAGETFGYDATGNRNTAGYGTTTGNRLSTDGTYNYAYDDEGNLVTKTQISGGNQTIYLWDYRNRLTEVDSKVGSTTTVIARYTYDAMGRRIGDVVGAATRWTAYDGSAAVLDFDGSGAQTVRYLHGPMVDELLARETPAGGVAWYLQDRQGTIRDIASNTGTIVDHIDFKVFGAVTAETAPNVGDRWKYTGRELDGETGLYQYRARYYDSTSGRFIGQDPIGFGGGDVNTYRYTSNNISNYVDPSGLYDDEIYPTDNPVITDLTISNPSNTIILIAPDGRPKPFVQGPHETLYPNFFATTYNIKPSNIFYFYNGATFQDAINQAGKLGLKNPQVILIGHAKYGTFYFDNTVTDNASQPARMGVYHDDSSEQGGYWAGTGNLNLFVQSMGVLKPGQINLVGCGLFNYYEGQKMRQLIQAATKTPTFMSSGTTRCPGRLTHGDGSDLETSPNGSKPAKMPGKATNK